MWRGGQLPQRRNHLETMSTKFSFGKIQFDVSIAAEDSQALLSTRPDNSEAARWALREIPAGPGYVAALCVRGHDWHLKDWSATD